MNQVRGTETADGLGEAGEAYSRQWSASIRLS